MTDTDTSASASASERRLRKDAEAFNAALSALMRLYQFRDRDRICCHDISVTQSHALDILAERGPLRSQALAEAMMLDKSTVTRVVDALVRKGYVERSPDPDDARALSLRVTAAGRALYDTIKQELIAQQAEMLRDLSPDVRVGATELLRRLGRSAQTRFLASGEGDACSAADCGPVAARSRCG